MKLPRYWDGKIKPVKPSSFAEKTVVPYRVPGLDADPVEKADVAQVGTGEETRGQTFQIERYQRNPDGSLMFDSEGNLIPLVRGVSELTDEEKVDTADIDVDEVDSDDKPVYQGIDQSKLVPLLVAALQEAVTRIEALEGS